ncbi:hypothetical protein G6F32_014960 [Rhizopus arrhizus]|nr:hypothetical protein G6F32_014960 [Rhizopus arrhizus]
MGVTQRVLQQVGQHLLQAPLVTGYLQRCGGQRCFQCQPRRGEAHAQAIELAAQQGHQVQRGETVGQAAGLGHRQVVQVVDQLAQLADLALQGTKIGAVQRADAVLDRLQFGTHHRQRRAEFVRDVGDEGTAVALGIVQRLRHPVEVVDQCIQLVIAGALDAGGVVAGGEPVGGRRELGQALAQRA